MFFLTTKRTGQIKLEELYEKYNRLMFSVIYGILKNYEESEDVLFEVWQKVNKNLKKINEIAFPTTKSFLVIISKNTAIDVLRKKKTRKILKEEQLDENHPENDENIPENLMVEKEHIEYIKNAISTLNDTQKEVLILKVYAGYSDKQIASVLGITIETAKKRIYRARQKIYKLLKEEGIL